jgi:Fe-S-cluster containining protein
MNPFPCTCCGACCRRLWLMNDEVLKKNGLSVNEHGHCTRLRSDNLCSIYDHRPEICRVRSHFKETAEVCNRWMDEDNSTSERVVIESDA